MKLLVNDVASSLDLPVTTIERWIRQGRIPINKSGSYCFFKRAVLTKWAEEHHMGLRLPEQEPLLQQRKSDSNSLAAAIRLGGVNYHVAGSNVNEVLTAAAECVPGITETQRHMLADTLIERENLMSTGVGKGVAIPHPRNPLKEFFAETMVVTCFLANQIQYQAVDDVPVFVLFIILCSDVKTHLNLLSRLSFCVRDRGFTQFLASQPEQEHFIKKIQEYETNMDDG